jgi:hypothetical protein
MVPNLQAFSLQAFKAESRKFRISWDSRRRSYCTITHCPSCGGGVTINPPADGFTEPATPRDPCQRLTVTVDGLEAMGQMRGRCGADSFLFLFSAPRG